LDQTNEDWQNVNNLHESTQFTMETSTEILPFLGLFTIQFMIQIGQLHYSYVHSTETDTHL
jgi:hypothetical protein